MPRAQVVETAAALVHPEDIDKPFVLLPGTIVETMLEAPVSTSYGPRQRIRLSFRPVNVYVPRATDSTTGGVEATILPVLAPPPTQDLWISTRSIRLLPDDRTSPPSAEFWLSLLLLVAVGGGAVLAARASAASQPTRG